MKTFTLTCFILCLAFILSVSVLPAGATPDESIMSEYFKGDVNGNGEVDSRDYLIAKRIILKTYDADIIQAYASDIDKDGKINPADCILIKRHILETYNIETSTQNEQIDLTEEKLNAIKSDYIVFLQTNSSDHDSLTIEDIFVKNYYGPYNGCYALFISRDDIGYPDASVTKTIAGYEFEFPNNQPLLIYDNNTFYEIEEAYNSKIISKDDLYDLLWYFYKF